ELADVVLPAATWGESEGTVTNMERRVSRVRAATETSPKIKQDLDIIVAVGAAIDPELFPEPAVSPESAFDELRGLTAGTPADLSGISYDRLEAERAVRWPAPSPEAEGGYRYVEDEGWAFPTPSGRARFSTGTHDGLAEPTDDEFPLTLTTGRQADAYNTGVRSRGGETETLPMARIHPETTLEYIEAFDRGKTVISSRRGSATIAVNPDDGVPEGMVWLPIHHPAVNVLTLPVVDPESDEPNFKQCAVDVRAPQPSNPLIREGRPSADGKPASSDD
ncbi:molybdopterin dinucleotide binding domain-containing protein, partial [Halorubrum lipolyticum]